ncbi:GTP-binding protein [Myceligenerans xiligouense]|uniref:Signal recognition particle receptor subunit beta n=1 Tax=Myceligenerans xiligouense TaxID=253184 RepID=A0A3N4Z4V4_9MICO|nr:ATP/GTP-binding protein [Myceligenerans xiligouense]RPF20252.1 signal recognition particle receptor subunit beta [Myceligenerans xiligouense]
MDSATSEPTTGQHLAPSVARSVKVLVVGAFGVGKTTLIDSVSEIEPLRTEEQITTASVGIDPGLPEKQTTTVALDFGRLTVSEEIALYMFGTPGQRRFWDLWAGLADGAVGALVMVDTRSIESSFEVLDQLELRTKMPFAVVINQFPDSPQYPVERIRAALDLLPTTPIVRCDARNRTSSAQALVQLVEHALTFPAFQKAPA